MIEDPLLAQAGYCVPEPEASDPTPPQSPISSQPDSAISINTNVSFPSKKGKGPRSPIKQRAGTPPLEESAYGSDYESDSWDEDEEEQEPDSHLLLHTRVYALAEKYDIPSLKQLAQRKFEMEMACYYDSPEFAEAIEEVYCSTVDNDRGLRDIVLQAFRCHPMLASTHDVYAVIKDTPSLAFELFKIERGLPV